MNEQGNTARSVNDFIAQMLGRREGYAQDERMMRLRQQLEREAQGNPLWGTLGSVLGLGLGGFAGGYGKALGARE
jgi:hypothetical protein